MNITGLPSLTVANVGLNAERKLFLKISAKSCPQAGSRLKQRNGGATVNETEHLRDAIGDRHTHANQIRSAFNDLDSEMRHEVLFGIQRRL